MRIKKDPSKGMGLFVFSPKKGQKKCRFRDCRNSIMVEDKGLEPMTSRTSSGCATSCANLPNKVTSAIIAVPILKSKKNFEKLDQTVNFHPNPTKYTENVVQSA